MQATRIDSPVAPIEPVHDLHLGEGVLPPQIYDTANMSPQAVLDAVTLEGRVGGQLGHTVSMLLARNASPSPDDMAASDARSLLEALNANRRAPEVRQSTKRDADEQYVRALRNSLEQAESDGLGHDHELVVALREELDRMSGELDRFDQPAEDSGDTDRARYVKAA